MKKTTKNRICAGFILFLILSAILATLGYFLGLERLTLIVEIAGIVVLGIAVAMIGVFVLAFIIAMVSIGFKILFIVLITGEWPDEH